MDIRELQKAAEELIFVGQAHRLGVFRDLHQKPDTAEGYAARAGMNPRAMRVLLEAMREMGYLYRKDGLYTVTEDAFQRLVQEGGPQFEGDFWQFLLYLLNPWRTLPHVLETGLPDKSSYKNFSMRDFIRGMDSPWKKKIAPEIVALCLSRCPHAKDALDVGGAPGTIARTFAAKGVATTIYDLPEANEVMKDDLSRVPGVTMSSGDATKSLPGGSYDIAFLGNICHGQSPEDNQGIITMCHEHLRADGIIVIFENLRGESYLGATLALHMITQSPNGDIYTREEYFRWMERAGFRGLQVEKISDPAWQLVFGYR